MKIIKLLSKTVFIGALLFLASCSKKLDQANENPNGVDPSNANPNLMLPTILTGTAKSYVDLGYGRISGVVQYTQEDGWFSGYNHYDWSEEDWSGWYALLRNNEFLYQRAVDLDYKLHQGIALTMKSFLFGTVADLWGNAPYTNALKGDEELLYPDFDSQETIYKGVLEDLKTASSIFASVGDASGYYAAGYDVYYDGDPEKWQKFANTLILRYAMRVSNKLTDIAKSNVEAIYSSGIYIQNSSGDATMKYVGATADNSCPNAVAWDGSESNWRRRKPAQTLLNTMLQYDDPRIPVWFQPVHVRWVADPALPTKMDEFIREDGVILTGIKSFSEQEFKEKIAAGHVYTRHFNPNTFTTNAPFVNSLPDTREYVGIPAGLLYPDYYNSNPTSGQTVENQHVSQLSYLYQKSADDLLRARLASAAETSFILAEAALKGWSAGSAETHYNNGVKSSLETWGVADGYTDYIAEPGVAYAGTLEQVLEQKWIAGWTAATEAWFDYRRTGLPALTAGPASTQPVLPVRFMYGQNELNNNSDNVNSAIGILEQTDYSGPRGKNSQWSKPWLLQGTSKPW